jgi:hypothetical protein
MTGLQTLSQKCLENLRLHILLFVLLYADDAILWLNPSLIYKIP